MSEKPNGFGTDDSGLLTFKTNEEAEADLKALGTRFEYSCCHSLGQWYETYMKDVKTAASIFRENCFNMNLKESCLKYAFMRSRGYEELKRNPTEAFMAVKHGCDKVKDPKSCQVAGMMLAEGAVGHGPSPTMALEYFEKGCQMKFKESCFYYGGLLMSRSQVEKDGSLAMQKKAMEAWKLSCELGMPLACKNLARAHSIGDIVEKSDALSKKYMELADNIALNQDEHRDGKVNIRVH